MWEQDYGKKIGNYKNFKELVKTLKECLPGYLPVLVFQGVWSEQWIPSFEESNIIVFRFLTSVAIHKTSVGLYWQF